MLAPAFRRVWSRLRPLRRHEPHVSPTVVVAQLFELGRPLEVIEAVAVVMALGDLAAWRGGDRGDLPSFESLGFDWAGRLVVLGEHPAGGETVSRLAQLLASVTRGTRRASELTDVIRRARLGRSQSLSLTEFLARLEPFGPRDRRYVLAKMVERMHAGEVDSENSAVVRRAVQRELVVAVGDDANGLESASLAPLVRRSMRGFFAALGLVLLGVGLALWTANVANVDRRLLERMAAQDAALGMPVDSAARVLSPAAVAAAEPVRSAESLPASGASSASPVIASATGLDAPAPMPPAVPAAVTRVSGVPDSQPSRVAPGRESVGHHVDTSTEAAARPERATPETARAAVPEFAASSTLVGAPTTTSAILWTRPVPPARPVSKAANTTSAGESTPVYSATRSDVEPAKLVRLPDDIRTADAPLIHGTIELVIDEQGTVEQVKLVAQGAYAEIQRLARAWRRAEFRPAQREGKPVRYRTTVPLEGKSN